MCDKGTALLLFWKSAPGFLYQYGSEEEIEKELEKANEIFAVLLKGNLKYYIFVREIEKKYLAGFYTNQNIKFDPRNNQGSDHTTRYSDITLKREIPEELLKASPGIAPERESF